MLRLLRGGQIERRLSKAGLTGDRQRHDALHPRPAQIDRQEKIGFNRFIEESSRGLDRLGKSHPGPLGDQGGLKHD